MCGHDCGLLNCERGPSSWVLWTVLHLPTVFSYLDLLRGIFSVLFCIAHDCTDVFHNAFFVAKVKGAVYYNLSAALVVGMHFLMNVALFCDTYRSLAHFDVVVHLQRECINVQIFFFLVLHLLTRPLLPLFLTCLRLLTVALLLLCCGYFIDFKLCIDV